jgi:hypothetical protein
MKFSFFSGIFFNLNTKEHFTNPVSCYNCQFSKTRRNFLYFKTRVALKIPL